MLKTNVGLVMHVKKALDERWGYVWGTFGSILTERLLQQKIIQYPKEVGGNSQFIRDTWIPGRTADCVGLIKSYIWNTDAGLRYQAKTDVSADMMYNSATVKGAIRTMQEIPGVCLWKRGHIGVYIGNGKVIEAHSTKAGVIKTPLKGWRSTAWTHWCYCPYIEYPSTEDIKAIQLNLSKLGYEIVVDGIFGPMSVKKLIQFQLSNNLEGDGVFKEQDKTVMIDILNRLEGPMKKDYIQLINENSDGHADDWIKGIHTAVKAAEADGHLGDLEIFKFLPQLIEKIGNRKNRDEVY